MIGGIRGGYKVHSMVDSIPIYVNVVSTRYEVHLLVYEYDRGGYTGT